MPDDSALGTDQGVRLTDSAIMRINQLVAAESNDAMMLRITISGGGCSGFQYGFALDDQRHDDDVYFERDGVTVAVDETSLELIRGAELDYVEDMMGAYFALKNPNAASTCGCGSSFAI